MCVCVAGQLLRGVQIFKNSSNHVKILGIRKVTHSKYHMDNPQILGDCKKLSHLGSLMHSICSVQPYVMYIHMYISFYVCMYVCICVCIYIYIYIYIHTHTHTYIHTYAGMYIHMYVNM